MNRIEALKKIRNDVENVDPTELEEALIASLLCSDYQPSQTGVDSSILVSSSENRAVFMALQQLESEGFINPELPIVLRRAKSICPTVSNATIGHLVNSKPNKDNVLAHAKQVINHAKWRESGAASELQYSLESPSGRTDNANSKRFADRHCSDLLFVPEWNRWLSWDGKRWNDDCGSKVMQYAKSYASSLWSELAELAPYVEREELGSIQSFIKSTNQAPHIRDFIGLASSDPRLVCHPQELNSDPMLLNVDNGTIELKTGEFRYHKPSDRITQIAPVKFDPVKDCPLWKSFIELVLDNNPEVIRYVQAVSGYCLSGDIGEHILPVTWGAGGNGKSVFWNTIEAVLGDYACTANDSLLLGENEGHPTEKAALYQKRFVAISEPGKGAKLKESRVKELTGDATITARRMREDFWSFRRTHKFWLSTNHLPRIDGTDEGIWRRVKLIPFTVNVRERAKKVIPNLTERIVAEESSGVLNWLLEGWRIYQAEGFLEPKAVTDATACYRSESDILGDWLAENCVIEPGAIMTAKEAFERYQLTGGKWTKTAFGRELGTRFEKDRPTSGEHRNKRIYRGIRLSE